MRPYSWVTDIFEMKKDPDVGTTAVGVVQADCICIVYLCVPVCVTEGGGASSTLA